ncbi:MAG: copper-translocating P-type ATPase, partial [Acidobacteria bacterium]|nr:copper-translocating P-type ATPase [Acidobacteriota bacterium]
LNMFTLIAGGTGIAWLYSTVAAIAPGIFPAAFHINGEVPVYFETAAVITVLVLVGQVLELRARRRTRAALQSLLRLAPSTARRIGAGGQEEDIPLDHVVRGDRLRVRPGGRVPVDGIVLEGSSPVDESMVSGESIPVLKRPGDEVIGGTLSGTGSFVMRAERIGDDTLLARIVRLVAEAQRSRAPIQRLADRVASWFVPAVLLTALGTFLIWSMVGPEPRMTHALLAAIAVLIIACPCALGLATPMSIMVGTGRGAAAGVLIRDAESLERLEKIDTLVIDKTGTLTEGRPEVTAVIPTRGTEDELLRLAASLERASEHPLAGAIVRRAVSRGLDLVEPERFEANPGHGVSGYVEGRHIALGTAQFVASAAPDGELLARAETLRRDGQTVLHAALEGRPAGLIGVADPIKPSAYEAVRALRLGGVRILMLTGDNAVTAQAVARRLEIDEVRAEVRPEEKAAQVRDLRSSGAVVAMAGDGINDAPALAEADVGIAMGTGTDIAMETAPITLVRGDLIGILRARRLSRGMMANIRQNLAFAFLYNALCVPIAAGILYPTFGLLLNPMIASVAMSFSSLTVIGNALRLRRLSL